jgi:hypothetical protein
MVPQVAMTENPHTLAGVQRPMPRSGPEELVDEAEDF